MQYEFIVITLWISGLEDLWKCNKLLENLLSNLFLFLIFVYFKYKCQKCKKIRKISYDNKIGLFTINVLLRIVFWQSKSWQGNHWDFVVAAGGTAVSLLSHAYHSSSGAFSNLDATQ